MIIAAIDIGSFNCRLTIAKKVNNKITILHNFSNGTNLIKNLSFNNEFTEANIKKTITCLKKFSLKLLEYNVEKYRCIATEACRQVINPNFFINKVKQISGIDVEIISSYEEAKLSLKSCKIYTEKIGNKGFIFDIGGGSTELTYFDIHKQTFETRSISFGVINLSEKREIFGKKIVENELRGHFGSFKKDLSENLESELYSIGSCSTITSLCAIHQKLKFFDYKKIESYEMTSFELLSSIDFIKSLSTSELKKLPCVKSRYNLLINGVEILKFILEMIPIKKVIVTQKGLRDGIMDDLVLQYEKNKIKKKT